MSTDKPSQVTPPRTDVALQGARIAGTFRGAFADTKLGSHTPDMTSPEDTTHGGKLALQHVTLRKPSGLTLVVGTVNCVEHAAEIHPYAYLAGMNQERFKVALDFDAAAYQEFVDKARGVLHDLGIELSIATMPASLTAAPSAATNSALRRTIFTLLVGLVIGGVVVWFALR